MGEMEQKTKTCIALSGQKGAKTRENKEQFCAVIAL